MQNLFLLMAITFFISLPARAEESCSICGLIVNNKSELVSHIIKNHPIKETTTYSIKHNNLETNLGLIAIIIYENCKHHYSYIELMPHQEEVWQKRYSIELEFNEQKMIITAGYHHKEIYYNCGSALLLLALHIRDHVAVKTLLDKPEDLAYLDIIDAQGKNSFQKAEEILSSCEYGSEEYKQWQEVTSKLQALFRFAQLQNSQYQSNNSKIPDFHWARIASTSKIECTGWRPRTREEAFDFVDPKCLEQSAWSGHCNSWPNAY